ncbi:MAG TPA: lipocalin-like domain-containing protein [Verrucomicrobiae bacterium]|jgi:predicted secreted hydrolase|nr:lipocalin-like domain-containing protein [Verrucomicrobiae bacterium]
MSRRTRAILGLAAALVSVGVVAAFARWPGRDGAAGRGGVQASLAVSAALGSGDLAGFARAMAPRRFSFPADLGPHPEFRTEWWYYTGNVETAAGRHFGFQLTFFRTALAPPGTAASARDSAWSATQLYLAHFALTDTAGRRFHAWSRLGREALRLAGASATPFRVWLEDWSAASEAPDGVPVRLRATEGDVAIDLVLSSDKPVVLQGDHGLSRKGPEPGNASYYYSRSRMSVRGSVSAGGEPLPVSGLAWMDREWSTSALGPDLVGWDWLALQLDDGRDVMVYRLRRRDGAVDPHSTGTLVAGDGGTRPLAAGDVTLDARDHWTSPRSRVRYPSRWRLAIPSAGLSLEITPRLADQELIVGTRYWEGAVRVEGTAAGRPIAGHGYVELVGYGD